MKNKVTPSSNIVAFDDYLLSIGKTRITGFRWRKKRVIETLNIFGRIYVTREAIAEFERRALSGEFSRNTAPIPRR
jgi:hypothetical protein